MALEVEQKPMIVAVVNALLTILPEDWWSAQLRIERTVRPGGVIGCTHSIVSSEHPRDFVEPSNELYAATKKLMNLFERYGRPWKSAKLSVQVTKDDKWDYTIDFEY